MTLELFRTAWPFVASILNFLFIIAVFALRKTFVTKQEMSELKNAHYTLKNEHQQLVLKVTSLPSQQDINKLSLSMEGLRGEIKTVSSTFKKTDHILNLIIESKLQG